ncbi:MAG: hypothetical protein HYR70_04160 [Chloroflexi bacterium]|nr:hypothetical protein [Chloroflexota bacterium]MBI3340750.1 hypothetical protein [Chloroflexota bacterium]
MKAYLFNNHATSYFNALTGAQTVPTAWQKNLKDGDFYEIAPVDGSAFPTIYGKILEVRDEGFFWVKAYSAWCPQGEEGLLCIVEPTRRITQEEFRAAAENNFTKGE